MNRRRVPAFLRSMMLVSAICAAAHAFADNLPPKSGTVDIQQVQVALLWSASLGGGTLNYNAKRYEFVIGGLGIGGIGASSLNASGEVYGLKQLGDFEGVYGQARTGYAAGFESSGWLLLENTKGVVLKLRAKRAGLALTLGADGVAVKFK